MERYIIIDETGKPMCWDIDQLCYCHYVGQDPFPVKTYTKKVARNYIAKTIANRRKWKMEVGSYKLMPIILPKTLTNKNK